ncbi:MAG: carbohydrate ABC transporter permease [Actinomycetota bacterium]|nr:carbohydrate ABC transporter permease [Actinomycetota bacterium]
MASADTSTYEIRRASNKWRAVRTYVGVAVIVVWGLLPFYWMAVVALRDVGFTFSTTPWPTHVTLDNFRTAFDESLGNDFDGALLNSTIISVSTTLLAMVVGVSAAYALVRMDFRGKYPVLGLIISASMFPPVALVTPLFQLFSDLDWIGTYRALIIPSLSFVLPLTIYLLTAFFSEMPWDLEEAARIDGCTKAQAFRKVILPLAAPGLFTTAILAFILAFNEFLLATLLSDDSTQPVTVAIAEFTGAQPQQVPYTAIMAAGTIVTIPLVIVVLIFQRRIVSGLTAGGVKG